MLDLTLALAAHGGLVQNRVGDVFSIVAVNIHEPEPIKCIIYEDDKKTIYQSFRIDGAAYDDDVIDDEDIINVQPVLVTPDRIDSAESNLQHIEDLCDGIRRQADNAPICAGYTLAIHQAMQLLQEVADEQEEGIDLARELAETDDYHRATLR